MSKESSVIGLSFFFKKGKNGNNHKFTGELAI